jgi:hypothetical protein
VEKIYAQNIFRAYAPVFCVCVDRHSRAGAIERHRCGIGRLFTGWPSGDCSGRKIVVREVNTNIASETLSTDEGYYRFAILPVGSYEIAITANGFKEYKQTGLSLAVGQKACLDVSLQLGAVLESIDVTADVAMVDTGAASVGSVLSEKEVNLAETHKQYKEALKKRNVPVDRDDN